jgi:nucleotide-binding universal stress UspA family protein
VPWSQFPKRRPLLVERDEEEFSGAFMVIIGATGHSVLYERLIGSRADRIVQIANLPGAGREMKAAT